MIYQNVKFLTDVEIIDWNKNIKDSPYEVRPVNSNSSPFMNITISHKPMSPSDPISHRTMDTIRKYDAKDGLPNIDFNFIFSVSSNRKDYFFEILSRIMSLPFESKFSYENSECDIPISDSLIKEKIEKEHVVINRKYTRYTYKFSGNLPGIIGYISCLRDAIRYFQMVYGYDENGNEHCILKYPIGTIVSKPKDKSKDYLVLDYFYFKDTNDNYFIEYNCCEILDISSSIIEYGKNKRYKDNELCFSRNNRIDNILN